MKLLKFLSIFLFAFWFTAADAQNKLPQNVRNQFAGTWSLVAIENTNADGSKAFPYGHDPIGLLYFSESGEYAIQILKAERPKVEANNKNRATPEENAALVRGSNSHFGTYTVDATNHTITFNVKHAFYPNWEGAAQVRSYTLENGVLTYVVTNTTQGRASTAKVVWKKKEI